MAAEGLEKAAKSHNCSIKVETRGSGGAKNVLTDEEIANADCVIVAADAQVPMDRFDGKKLIEVPVSDGISKADQLVERAISGDAPIYHSSNAGSQSTASKKASGGIGHRLYVHLMNGVSHMLPFVVGGGILIAIAFLIDGMNVDINSLSADMRANFGTITPVAAAFKQIGGIAFGLMLPVLAGFIAMSIGDRPALAVGFVGGMIAANGKSGFLGALAAGFLAGLIILLLKKVFSRLPDALEKITPVLLYPVCGILLMGLVMMFVIEPPVGALNTALNTALTNMGASSKILLGIVCAGMMAIDMGGPFNKAAYVFGTAAIVAGNYDIMAAVMIGGMVPPCAIALATLLFKNNLQRGTQIRTGQLYYGTCIYHRRCNSICSSRSDPCPAVLYGWFSGSRCIIHGIRMYTDGTTWWNLCCTGYGQCRHVSGGTCSRNHYFRRFTRSLEEKSK